METIGRGDEWWIIAILDWIAKEELQFDGTLGKLWVT